MKVLEERIKSFETMEEAKVYIERCKEKWYGPIGFIEVAGFYLAYFAMINPSSKINILASILPISSPFSMPFRMMLGTATTSQIITSLIVLIITIILIAKISIKIYSSAILNYGTKLNFKDMMKIYSSKE